MGKGDQRSKRGKIFAGSFGKTRPHKRHKKEVAPAPPVKPEPASKKKAPAAAK